jgi:cytochrome c oxidase cbb3-type subunit 3
MSIPTVVSSKDITEPLPAVRIAEAALDAAPEAEDDARLMHHAYDGIREYDNPLPGWWKAIFAGTIVFAAVYGFYFHIARWGQTPEERYQTALAEFNEKKVMRDRAEAASVSEQMLARNAGDAKLVEHGASVFAAKCVGCHTADGRGQIGPNLTDLYQIHGTTRMDIYHTIHDGAPGTAMIAWGDQLPAADVLDVAAFITTLRGKNLVGKEPQGEKVEPFQP